MQPDQVINFIILSLELLLTYAPKNHLEDAAKALESVKGAGSFPLTTDEEVHLDFLNNIYIAYDYVCWIKEDASIRWEQDIDLDYSYVEQLYLTKKNIWDLCTQLKLLSNEALGKTYNY